MPKPPPSRVDPSPRAAIDPLAVNAVLIAVRQAANVVCDRWSLVLLLLAHAGVYRIGDLRERSGMASRQLAARLQALEAQEILVRLPYSRRPLRHGYHLTHMGLALFDFFGTLLRWEDAWHPAAGEPAVTLTHTACDARRAGPVLRCGHCRGEITSRSVGRLEVSQKGIERMPERLSSYRISRGSIGRLVSAERGPLAHGTLIFGDKWSIELVVCAFLRIESFGGFQTHTGVASNILADRLTRLVQLGIFEQVPLPRSYRLTDEGKALYPVLLAIQRWADAWLRDRYRAPIRLRHLACGEPLQLVLTCDRCDQPLERQDARLTIA